MPTPLFSIIVPTYNQADFLVQALDSLIAQTEPDWEALVVNDGSTDHTAEVLERYAQRDSRIKPFHKDNGGTGSALNEGLRNASGRWVCWLSSDDMFDPRKLEIHREWIAKYPDCRFFFTYFRLLREATGEITDHDLWGPLPDPKYQIIILFFRNYVSGITICIERNAWENVGFFDESLRYAQDYDMWLRILAQHKAQFIPEWTVTNRNHAGQGSEVFPQACYFDTSKAGLRFINSHTFPELVPWVDLTDPSEAAAAVAVTLETAAEPTAFIYALGGHAALVSRIVEWLNAPETVNTAAGKAARLKAMELMPALANGLRGTAIETEWCRWEGRLCDTDGQCCYLPVVPAELGEASCQALLAQGHQQGEALRKYLAQFEGIEIDPCALPKPPLNWDGAWMRLRNKIITAIRKLKR